MRAEKYLFISSSPCGDKIMTMGSLIRNGSEILLEVTSQVFIFLDILIILINLFSLDYLFFCPQNYFAQKFAEYGSSVYYYYFTQVNKSSIFLFLCYKYFL